MPSQPHSPQLFLAPTGGQSRRAAFDFLQSNARFDPLEPPLILTSAANAPAWRALFREKSGFMPRLISPEEFFARSHGANVRGRAVAGRDRLWILSQVARQNAPLLRHLKDAALSRDWVAGFAQLFGAMRRAQNFEWPETPWREDLERLWHAYNARLAVLNAFDFEEAPALFAQSAPQNAAFSWPKFLIVDDPGEFSPALQIGLNALLERAEIGIGTLCAPGNERANPALRDSLAFWKNRRAKVVQTRRDLTPNDRAAARVLGARNGQSAPFHVHLSAFHTPFEEFSAIASHIRGELENGASPENFTLVVPALARFATSLEAAFEAHGVPLALPFSRPLLESPLVRRLLQLFGACGHDWNAHLLHDLFGDGTLVLPGFDAARLRRAALAARFYSLQEPAKTRLAWETRLEQLRQTRQDDRTRREAIEASLEAGDLEFVAQIQTACVGCAGEAKSSQKIGGAAWLESLESLTSLFCAHFDEAETELAILAREQLQKLREAAHDVVSRAREFDVDGEEIARRPGEWLEWLRLECEGQTPAPARAGVRVSGAPLSLDWSGTIFFAGLCEGAFPAPEVSGPLAARGGELFERLRTGASPLARATHVLARALAESKTLYLSHSLLEWGREIAPSPLLDDLRALWEKHPFPLLAPAQNTSRERFLRALSSEHPDLPPFLATLCALQRERNHPQKIGVYEGALGQGGPALMSLWRQKNGAPKLSASALEAYARCPLRFFFERVLGLQTSQNGDDLDAAQTGSLLHEILFAFHQAHRAPLCAENEAESLELLRQKAWKACQNLPLRPILREAEFHRLMGLNGVGGPLWKTLRAQIAVASGGPWSAPTRPLLHSQWRAQLPDIKLGLEQRFELQIGQVALVGTMDRLDISDDGAILVILDYKSGGLLNLPSLGDGDDGLHFQLGLYALKAREYFGDWPVPPRLAMGFLSLKTGEFSRAIGQSGTLGRLNEKKFAQKKSVELDDAAWESWLALLESRIQNVGALLERGTFNISLRDAKSAKCEHCDWKTTCGQNAKTQNARSENLGGGGEFYLPERWEVPKTAI